MTGSAIREGHLKRPELETEIYVNTYRKRGKSNSELGGRLERIPSDPELSCNLHSWLEGPAPAESPVTLEGISGMFCLLVLPYQEFSQLLKYTVKVELGSAGCLWIPFIILSGTELPPSWPCVLPLLYFHHPLWFFLLTLRTDGCLLHSLGSPIYSDCGMEKNWGGLIKVPFNFLKKKTLVENFKKRKQRGTKMVSEHSFFFVFLGFFFNYNGSFGKS